ncbi:NAD-binding protein [Sanghuangporus baumii]|uniref:NAD-binding protein n=1 Tax=Sanghuangporus baumii TaxID=108892 RepID=A0A9Q5N3U1_SANBA|nr:NAD-binding protein [Sanghuangporus baumii]
MSAYKHFAVVGAGSIGRVIVEELVKKKDEGRISSIVVLTRSSGWSEDIVSKGVEFIQVDYRSPSSLEAALIGVDVVISTLSLLSAIHQTALATYAKAAGVKLFVPSQFDCDPNLKEIGLPYAVFCTGLLTDKVLAPEVFRRNLKEIKLPYAVFCTGLLTDKVLAPTFATALGLDFSSGEFSIPGSGTAPISWTATEEVAQFIAHVLTTFPREKIEWRTFQIEGERINLKEIVASWEKRFRKTAMVTHRPRAVIKAAVNLDATDFLSSFVLDLDAGYMAVGDPSNREFPKWRPKRVIDVLDDLYED